LSDRFLGGESQAAFGVNPDTKHDRTLPISTLVPCPSCGARRAKFQKHRDDSMALTYLCLQCEGSWNTT
jgi:DNA-directed RNA polymerase subunit M/transcription elongation factor TFIIS